MMHGEGIYIYMYVYYWAQSDCITGRVEAVPVQVMYWWDFAASKMNRDEFRDKDDAKDVYSAVSSLEWNGEMMLFWALGFPHLRKAVIFKVYKCSKWRASSCGQNE